MNASATPQDTESLILYLSSASLRSARTIDALHSLCPDETTIDETLAWVIDQGYVYPDEGSFELTFAGLDSAREAQIRAQGQQIASPTHKRMVSRETESVLPKTDTHPMRTRSRQAPAVDQPALHYMLAFETPQNILPIPVLNGDILGRTSDAHIKLEHDEFISGQHCRFSIERKQKQSSLAIEDLGSRNGTYVDEFRLEKGQRFNLEHGSRIRLGTTVLIVVEIPY